jgi:hypothetical protein
VDRPGCIFTKSTTGRLFLLKLREKGPAIDECPNLDTGGVCMRLRRVWKGSSFRQCPIDGIGRTGCITIGQILWGK